jgi:hypothetical protein
MRTTIKIDDALLTEAKTRAADSGRTLDAMVGWGRAMIRIAESGGEWIATDRGSGRFPGLRRRHPPIEG